MHANLVLSSGGEAEFHHRIGAALLDGPVACHGELALCRVGSRVDLVCRILGEIAAYYAFFRFKDTVDNRHILALEHHVVPVVLHVVLCLRRFGKHHQAGGLLVEAMDDEELVARVLALEVVAEEGIGRPVLLLVGSHRQKSVALVYNYYGVVLIDDFQSRIAECLEFS